MRPSASTGLALCTTSSSATAYLVHKLGEGITFQVHAKGEHLRNSLRQHRAERVQGQGMQASTRLTDWKRFGQNLNTGQIVNPHESGEQELQACSKRRQQSFAPPLQQSSCGPSCPSLHSTLGSLWGSQGLRSAPAGQEKRATASKRTLQPTGHRWQHGSRSCDFRPSSSMLIQNAQKQYARAPCRHGGSA